jgi:hypothetical protein
MAPQTLLFTRINTITTEHRNAKGCRSLFWSITGHSHFDSTDISKERTLHINASIIHPPEGVGDWHIASQESQLSYEFKDLIKEHRLRQPIKIELAASSDFSNSQHKLFTIMPLPISTQLPIHLSAPFILAPDRRNIRLDGPALKYNSWLLSHLAAPLYLHLLETLLSRHQKDSNWWQWWPKLTEDVLLGVLTYSIYSYIPDTDRRICVSVVGIIVCPREAVFLVQDSKTNALTRLLLFLKPRELVQIPLYIGEALNGRVKTVDSKYVKEVIVRYLDHVKAAFISGQLTIHDVEDIIDFLMNDNGDRDILIGLPLLPLADGTLAIFGWSSETTCYYTWKPSLRNIRLFPLDRLVDSRFRPAELPTELNISGLDGPAIRDLLHDRIPETSEQDYAATDNHCSVIAAFWSEFRRMDLEADDDSIQQFALVPTTTPRSYISLDKCATDTVIVMGRSASQRELSPILSHLGAIIVQMDSCPISLRNVLDQGQFPHFSTDTVLSFFKTIDSSIITRFSRLTAQEHQRFAQWGREEIENIPEPSLLVACRLPIWPVLDGTTEGPFLAASDIIMLPAAITINSADALRFCKDRSKCVAYSHTLQHVFKVMPLDFTQFRDHLNLSRSGFLHRDEIQPYRNILATIIHNRHIDNRDVLVPNTNQVLEYSGSLYARSQPLFRETFKGRRYQNHLVHPDFQELEAGLGEFYLQNSMDVASFQACVRVIHEDVNGARRVERATLLYGWYCDTLPILLAEHGPYSWRQFDGFRFIPRSIRSRQTSYDQTPHVHRSLVSLELFAPTEVLRSEYEAVAWTQRVSFMPSDRLSIADTALGVPTAVEVVSTFDPDIIYDY